MMNETQMTSLNFWMTGTVYFQLSPGACESCRAIFST